MKRSILPLVGAAMAVALCARASAAQGVSPQALDKAPPLAHAPSTVMPMPKAASSLAAAPTRAGHAPRMRKVQKGPAAARIAVPASLTSGPHALMNQPAPGHAPAARMNAGAMTDASGFAKTAPAGHAPTAVRP